MGEEGYDAGDDVLFGHTQGRRLELLHIRVAIDGSVRYCMQVAHGREILRGDRRTSDKRIFHTCLLRAIGVPGLDQPSRRKGL